MADVEHGILEPHADVPGEGSGIHTAIGWPAFLTDSARIAQALGPADIGKLALVSDVGAAWMLTGLSPTRWLQFVSMADLATALSTKADSATVTALSSTVASKADTTAVNTALAAKADTTYVNTQVATRASQADYTALYNQVQGLTPAGSLTGPGSSTDNALARFDGTAGSTLQNSAATLDDSGNLTCGTVNGVAVDALATTVGNHTSSLASKVTGPASSVDNQLVRFDGTTGKLVQAGANTPTVDDAGNLALASGATVDGVDVSALAATVSGHTTTLAGAVMGPASATDNAVARFDATTGKLIQSSAVTIDDSGNIATSGTVDGVDVSALSTTVTNQGSTLSTLSSSMTTVAAIPVGSNTDNAVVRFDGAARNLQQSLVTIDDSGNISTPGTVDGVDVSALPATVSAKADVAYAVNNQTGTTYTLVLADAGRLVTLNNAAAVAVTIPANSAVAFPVGTVVTLLQLGAGQVTVGITTDTLNNPSLTTKTRVRYSMVTLTKITTTQWIISGDLAAT